MFQKPRKPTTPFPHFKTPFQPTKKDLGKRKPGERIVIKWPNKTVFVKFHPPNKPIDYLLLFFEKHRNHPNKLVRNKALFAEYFRSPEFERFVHDKLGKLPVGTVAEIHSDRKFNGGNAKIIIYVKKTGQGPNSYVIQDYEIVVWSSGNPHIKDPSKIIELPSGLFRKFRDFTYELRPDSALPQNLAEDLLPYFEKTRSNLLVFSLPYPEKNPYFFTKFTVKKANGKLSIAGISTKIVTSRQANL
jgi:hypothetical protein